MRALGRISLLGVAGLLVLATVPASSAAFVDTGGVETTLASTAAAPVPLAGIEAGVDFSLGWTANGTLYAWGANDVGQLGLGDSAARDTPTFVPMPGGASVVSASAGVNASIALTSTGDVYTWGSSDIAPSGAVPGLIPALSGQDVVGVSSGGFFFLAWTGDGRLFSWGNNGGGRLGRTGTGIQLTPARVTAQGIDSRVVTSAAAGRHFGTALTDGATTVLGWGSFFNAAAGVTFSGLPTDSTAAGIDAGDAIVFAWTADGRLFSGDTTFAFTQNSTLAGVAIRHAVASLPQSGPSSYFAWGDDGVLYGWGLNTSGQLGLGDTVDRATPTPVPVPGGSSVAELAEGNAHTLFIGQDGAFSATGSNTSGQLGTDDTVSRNTFSAPVFVVGWP
ncbi:RCC1 domain-containing protein [Leifsonia sp. Le1]|uniref:RCC1 domain-containing protein n=1 Tax=Leifsonia sp. Le1 TaxID=3404918 RepID=UPI003EBC8FD2